MERVEIASLYKATPADGTKVTVCGWAKTVRDSKKIGFISLADGSCYKPVQIVFQADKLKNYAEVAKSGLYTSFEVTGTLVLTPNAKQPFEINADTVTVLGTCGSDYPLQKNKMCDGVAGIGTCGGVILHTAAGGQGCDGGHGDGGGQNLLGIQQESSLITCFHVITAGVDYRLTMVRMCYLCVSIVIDLCFACGDQGRFYAVSSSITDSCITT